MSTTGSTDSTPSSSAPSVGADSPHFLAAEGSVTELEKLIKKSPALLDAEDRRGRTVVHYAALADNLKTLQWLRKSRSLFKADGSGATPLHWAVQTGAAKCVKFIMQTALELREKTPSKRIILTLNGVTPLHIAARRENAKILKILIEHLSESNNVFKSAQDSRCRSPLHYAAAAAAADCVQLLIDTDHLGLPVDQMDGERNSPLSLACGTRIPTCVEVVRALVLRKPIALTKRNNDGLSPMHIAVAANNLPVIALLIELSPYREFEPVDNDQRTPLHYAADGAHLEAVRILLAGGARPTARDKSGATPAHYAAQHSYDVMRLLLDAAKEPDLYDNERRSCLMWAVVAGNEDCVDKLIAASKPYRMEVDIRHYTALHLAAMVGHEHICKTLFGQGWNLKVKEDLAALHLAAGRGHTDVVRFLVTSGAPMSETDSTARTALFYACLGGQAHTLWVMIGELNFEWQVDRRPIADILGRTPLHCAAFVGFVAAINVLLRVEADFLSGGGILDCLQVDAKDNDGHTALHVAAERGRLDCVKELLRHGAAVNAFSAVSQETPLDLAHRNQHNHVCDYLRFYGGLTTPRLRYMAVKIIQRAWRSRLARKLQQLEL